MGTLLRKPDKGDPSDIQQIFSPMEIRLLCCRYWWFAHWEFSNLAHPYWRLYFNPEPGAYVHFHGQVFELTPNKYFLIAPNTAYASKLSGHEFPKEGYKSEGGKVRKNQASKGKGMITHLFIHFSLGEIYDSFEPGIYAIDADTTILEKIQSIINETIENPSRFGIRETLLIQNTIAEALSQIPNTDWVMQTKDTRMLHTIKHIRNNLRADLSNSSLAGRVNLTPQSFYRLFKKETKMSAQAYVRKSRITKACEYLHHTDHSIEEIAYWCGFSDRNHFTRIFKEVMNIPPVQYRKIFMSNA